MKTRNLVAALIVTSVLAGASVLLGVGESLTFSPSEYYILSLGGVSVDVAGLTQAAEAEGFTLIEYQGNTAVARIGDQPTTESVDSLLTRSQLLIVDGDRFLLRVAGQTSSYTVRPSADGLDLVFSPTAEQTLDDVVAILLDLQGLGIIGNEVDLGFEAYAKDAQKGPAPPAGAMIESDLYWLTVAEDWHAFAGAKGLNLVGLRVEIVAEKLPGSEIPTEFASYVTGESDSLARLLLPIERLVELATSGDVGLLRQAYEPVAP